MAPFVQTPGTAIVPANSISKWARLRSRNSTTGFHVSSRLSFSTTATVAFLPRTNVWLPAYPDEQDRFVAPDKEDWVLQFGVGPTGQRARVTDDTTMRGLTICRMRDGSIMGG
jgi:hypothetical protein